MNFAIEPIQKMFDCRTPMTEQQTQLLMMLVMGGEENIPPNPAKPQGIMAIAYNALAENGVTAHDALVALISISLHGNAGMAHAVFYSIARTAFKRRTTHINHEVLVDTFPYGFPSYAQFGEYWDTYKAAAAVASREGLETMFRPCLMLNALRAANVDFSAMADDEILKAYNELDDDAGDENYALPA